MPPFPRIDPLKEPEEHRFESLLYRHNLCIGREKGQFVRLQTEGLMDPLLYIFLSLNQ